MFQVKNNSHYSHGKIDRRLMILMILDRECPARGPIPDSSLLVHNSPFSPSELSS